MTPFQKYGQASAPSNMSFPTAAYLQAAQNAASMQASGMNALGSGLASGISSVINYMDSQKEEQARFNATKKMYSAFKSFLPEESRAEIEGMFSDTGMSVRDKNQIAPLLMNMIAQGQQLASKKDIANIMADSRQAVADAKNQPPPQREEFSINSPDAVFNTPSGGAQQQEPQPDLTAEPISGTRPKRVVWSSRLNKYVELD